MIKNINDNESKNYIEDSKILHDEEELKYLKKEYFSNKEYLLNPDSKKSFGEEQEVDFSSDEYNAALSKDHLNQFTLKADQSLVEKLLSLFNFHKFLQNVLTIVLKILNAAIFSESSILRKFKNIPKLRGFLRKLMLALQTLFLLKLIGVILRLKKEKYKSSSQSASEKLEYKEHEEQFRKNEHEKKEYHKHHDRSENSESKEHEKISYERSKEKSGNIDYNLYNKKYDGFKNLTFDDRSAEKSALLNISHYSVHHLHINYHYEPHPLYHFEHLLNNGQNVQNTVFQLSDFINKVSDLGKNIIKTTYKVASDITSHITNDELAKFSGYDKLSNKFNNFHSSQSHEQNRNPYHNQNKDNAYYEPQKNSLNRLDYDFCQNYNNSEQKNPTILKIELDLGKLEINFKFKDFKNPNRNKGMQ